MFVLAGLLFFRNRCFFCFFFLIKMNHVLMSADGDCLSLFLKTTQSVYSSGALSGLVVRTIKSCVSPLEGMKCRLITANAVTHISGAVE